jgi:hypothetical protein
LSVYSNGPNYAAIKGIHLTFFPWAGITIMFFYDKYPARSFL